MTGKCKRHFIPSRSRIIGDVPGGINVFKTCSCEQISPAVSIEIAEFNQMPGRRIPCIASYTSQNLFCMVIRAYFNNFENPGPAIRYLYNITFAVTIVKYST